MIYIFFIVLIFVVFYFLWEILTRKYVNPYQLYLVFGHKGCGKSTMMQKLVKYYSKKKYTCYCNIGDSELPDVIQIPIDDLPRLSEAGHRIFHYKDFSLAKEIQEEYKKNGIKSPPFIKVHSVIFVDEINLKWDNRNYKSFSPEMQKYFRLQRHYKHIFIGFSQTYDCDKKIRDLADFLLICRKTARVWVHTKCYYKKTIVISPEKENSRETAIMTDDFIPMGFFYDLTSPFQAWLPKWVKFHDSFK